MARSHTVALIALLIAVAGCVELGNAANAEPVPTDVVEMQDNSFVPAAIEVASGASVTWRFTDNGRAHNVAGDDFESPVQGEGTYTHTFDAPGTHQYRCTLHAGMAGRVIVTP